MPIPRRRFFAASAFACMIAAAVAAQVQSLLPATPNEWTGKPALVSFIGPRSEETAASISRPADQKAWAEVWKRHVGDAPDKGDPSRLPAPEIDFSTCMVVAIFDGKTVNSNGLYVVGIEETPDRILLRYDDRSYQTMSIGKPDTGNACTPYGFFVMARSAKPLVIEENVQGLIGQPPVWKERAKFPGL